eukprot:COSAG03_NODE_588_length_6843_cov_12.500297_9_plen_393_part_00
MSARSYGVESLSSAQVAFFKVFHLLKALRHTKAARCAQLAAVRICPHSPLGVWACSATATCSFPPSWTLPWYARRVTAGGSACQRAWGCPRTSRIAGWVASLARIRPRWSATERGRKSTRSTVRWVRPRATLRAGWAGDPPAPSLPPSLSRARSHSLTHPRSLSPCRSCRMVGGDEAFLNLLPRACWGAAQQLCGADTLIYPAGDTQPGANYAHPGANVRRVGSPGQACRGVYARLPPDLSPEERAAALKQPIGGGHVDGWDGDRWRFSVSLSLSLSLSLSRALSLALALLLYRSLARALSAGMCVCFVRSTPHWMIRARETARLLCGQAPICACTDLGTIAMTRRRCDLSGKNGDCKSMLCAHREFLLRAQGETGYPSNVAGSARRTTFPE